MRKILILLMLLISNMSYSQSKIFEAIEKEDVNYVSDYIKKGKDLNVTFSTLMQNDYNDDNFVYTYDLLEFSAVIGNIEIMKLFLSCKDKLTNYKLSLNKAFAASISKGKIDNVKLLLNAGADINAVCDACYGQTAIQTSLEYSYFDIFNYLLSNGADLKVENNNGRTLLHSVSHTGSIEIAKLLVDKGLSVNARDDDSATPIMYAASNGKMELFRFLLDKGADLNAIENDSTNILIDAAEGGNIDLITFILDKGFDINYQSGDGESPLICASAEKQKEVVKFLVNKGADINLMNKNGETALLWAIWNDDAETARFLIDKGADLTNSDYLKQASKYVKDKTFIKYLKDKLNSKPK